MIPKIVATPIIKNAITATTLIVAIQNSVSAYDLADIRLITVINAKTMADQIQVGTCGNQ